MEQTVPVKNKKNIFKVICSVLGSLILVFLLLLFIARIYLNANYVSRYVSGTSMEPTLSGSAGEYHYLYLKKVDEETKINRFDIVALHKDEYNDWIKRVVGLPHETLSYQEGILYINGQRIDEPFIHPSYFFNFNVEEIVLGENEYYVIGDNRHDTTKSIIQKSQIYGINGFIFKTCTQPNKNGMGIFESGCKITYKKL